MRGKKSIGFVVAIILFSVASVSSFAQDAPATAPAEKINYAVMPLKNGDGVTEGEASLITDRLRIEIFQTGEVEMMEREQMQDILKEQGFQNSGACDEESCLVEMGQMLGVERMITGSLGRLGATMFMLNLRVIDVGTGKLLSVESVDIRGQIEDVVGLLPGISKSILGLKSDPKVAVATTVPVAAPAATPAPALATTPATNTAPVPESAPNDETEAKETVPSKAAIEKTSTAKDKSNAFLTHAGIVAGSGFHFVDSEIFQDDDGGSLIHNVQISGFLRIKKYFHLELGTIISFFEMISPEAGGAVTYNRTDGTRFTNGELELFVVEAGPGLVVRTGFSADLSDWMAMHVSVGYVSIPYTLDVNLSLPNLDVTPIRNPYGESELTAELANFRLQFEFLQNSLIGFSIYGGYLFAVDPIVEYSDGYQEWRESFIEDEPEVFDEFDFSGLDLGVMVRLNLL